MPINNFISMVDMAATELIYSKFGETIYGAESGLPARNNLVMFEPPEVLQRKYAEKEGKSHLNFAGVWRTSAEFNWEIQRTPVARRGIDIFYDDADPTKVINYKSVPFKMEYDVTFWVDTLDKTRAITEIYLFWTQTEPKLKLTLDNLAPVEFDLHFGKLEDDSSLPEQYGKGWYYKLKAPLTIDAWAFIGVDYSVIKKIQMTMFDNGQLSSDAERLSVALGDDSDNYDKLMCFVSRMYGIVGAGANYFIIGGSFTDDFTASQNIFIVDSTGNDGKYTVESVFAESNGDTLITVAENVPDTTADGYVTYVEHGNG